MSEGSSTELLSSNLEAASFTQLVNSGTTSFFLPFNLAANPFCFCVRSSSCFFLSGVTISSIGAVFPRRVCIPGSALLL